MRHWTINSLLIIVILSMGACSTIKQVNKPESGYYYKPTHNKNTSLLLPPELTTPDFKNDQQIDKRITDTNKRRVFIQPEDIKIKRYGNHRYLATNKSLDLIWRLTQDFLRKASFNIEKSQINLGLLETNYLKREIIVPSAELNFIRSALSNVLKTNYVRPVLDKYLIRIEKNQDEVEIYLTIRTIAELEIKSVSTDAQNTEWILRPPDANQEAIMLYRLMAYLSGSIAPLTNMPDLDSIPDNNQVNARLQTNAQAEVSLLLTADKEQAWRHIAWALDRLAINIEDKDKKEGAFYIHTVTDSDKGFFSKLLGKEAAVKTFQIFIRQADYKNSEVFINILSKNDEKNKEFNKIFLTKIAKEINQNSK